MSGTVAQTIERLQELAGKDPTVAPLVSLQVVALRAAGERTWSEGVPAFERGRLDDGLPLLHGQALTVDGERIRALLSNLVTIAEPAGNRASLSPLRRALEDRRLDPLHLLEVSITQDFARLEATAGAVGVDPGVLITLAGLAALPLLYACGERAASVVKGARWEEGYCPVCAAWPALAEMRGLERRRWLRCGRCAAGWSLPREACAFCGNTDFRTLGYLAPERDPETRRAMTCEQCRTYLKTFTTLGPFDPVEIAVSDVSSLELDMAAIERGFGRPEERGFPLVIRVEAGRRRFSLMGWRR